jgi:hypothetical protein
MGAGLNAREDHRRKGRLTHLARAPVGFLLAKRPEPEEIEEWRTI